MVRSFSRRISSFSAVMILGLSMGAGAVPISFGNGMLEGTLRIYTFAAEDPVTGKVPITLIHDYTLGTDFFPGVPLSNQQNGVAYSACMDGGINTPIIQNPPSCFGSFFATLSVPLFSLDPSQIDSSLLLDGCSGVPSEGHVPPNTTGRALMVERGGCAFSDKWYNAEIAGWGGVFVVNDAAGPAAAAALIPEPIEPTVAFMRLSKHVGQQILVDRRTRGLLGIEMRFLVA